MSTDPLTLLTAANPVRELPPVAPVESLSCLTESLPASHARSRLRPRRLALSAAVVGLVAAGIGLALSTGSSGPGVDVAAAAYAATSAGNRAIEAEFVIRSELPDVSHAPLWRHREWLDAATGRRREQTLTRSGKVEMELATSPGSAEVWSSGPSAGGTIFRFKDQVPAEEKLKPDGLALYRRLYQGGSVRVVGREALDGRSLWKLEGDVGFIRRADGKLQPIFAEVVLVDPTTYLPVVERQVDLTRPGHPTLIETRLIRYRRLSQNPSREGLVSLSVLHSGARIATQSKVHALCSATQCERVSDLKRQRSRSRGCGHALRLGQSEPVGCAAR